MKKLMIYLDEDVHEDLRELAFRKKTTMAALLRYALDKTFEDELDDIASSRSLREYLDDPEKATSLDEFLKEQGIELPSPAGATRGARATKVAEAGDSYSVGPNRRSGRGAKAQTGAQAGGNPV